MTVRIHPGLVLLLALVGLADASPAALHVVPDTYPSIQAAIDVAASGDTVQVHAGQYPESLTVVGKDLVMIGEGPLSTMVRPSMPARVLRIGPWVTLSAYGFSFAGGQASQGGGLHVGEGAVTTFRSCHFTDNLAISEYPGRGGGVFVYAGARLVLRRCLIRKNSAAFSWQYGDAVGGGICALAGAVVDAESTAFERNASAGFEGGFGGAVALAGEGYFQSCTFDSNFAGYAACIGGNGLLSISGSVFRFNQGVYGPSTVSFAGDPYVIQTSVFHDNTNVGWHTLHMVGNGTIEFNTFAFNESGTSPFYQYACVFWEGTSTIIRNNIVAQNRQWGMGSLEPQPAGAVRCNDVWLNRDGNYADEYALPDLTWQYDNLSVNPYFCDSTARDLDLRMGAPLANFGTCGQIGALPVGCGVTDAGPGSVTTTLELLPARPHPLRGSGVLSFVLATPSHARLEVLDVAGRRVAVVFDGWLPAGRHEQSWSARGGDGSALPAGVYVLRLEAGGVRRVQRLVVLGR